MSNCREMRLGTTVEEPLDVETDGHDWRTWMKIAENTWTDNIQNLTATDQQIDGKQEYDGAELVVVELDVDTEEVPVDDLDPDDYVIVTWGFWYGMGQPRYDEDMSQMLWRVAGWTCNETGRWALMLDAPEGTLVMINRAIDGPPHGRVEPIEIEVDPADTFHVVQDGQQHTTWDYDWESEYGQFVQPPEPVRS